MGSNIEFLKNYARVHALKIVEKLNSAPRLHFSLTINDSGDSAEYFFKEKVERSETVTVTYSFVISFDVDLQTGMSAVNDIVLYFDKLYQQSL